MRLVGIETRATIPLKNLQEFEKELFSLGFDGSLSSGIGLFPNGIILRSEEQQDDPEVLALEFSYPPFDVEKEEMCENVCNQYSAFFHLIKQYGGNPYPWYINLEEVEYYRIPNYTDNVRLVRGIAICSINPLHLTLNDDYNTDIFLPFSLGEVNFEEKRREEVIRGNELMGPYLFLKSKDLGKTIDLRETAKDFVFDENRITFGVRVSYENRKDLHHFALTALPQDILPRIKEILPDDIDFKKLGEKIRYGFYSLSKHNLFISTEDLTLGEIENELENLKDLYKGSIPIKEIISNRRMFRGIAEKYLEEKWRVKNDALTNAYALFLSQIEYVDKRINDVDKRLYDVTNFPVAKFKEGWLAQLAKKYRINVHHNLSLNEENGIVNYEVETRTLSE